MNRTKGAQSYSHLHQNLINKINAFEALNQITDTDYNYYEDQHTVPTKYDKINYLIEKAKGVTSSNQSKLTKAKAIARRTSRNTNTAFLTGVYIVEPERVYSKQDEEDVETGTPNNEDFLQQLNQIRTDDLAQLRRMIKETDHRLNNYGRNLSKTKSGVLNAAQRLGKSVDPLLNMRIQQCSEFLPKLQRKGSFRKMPSNRK